MKIVRVVNYNILKVLVGKGKAKGGGASLRWLVLVIWCPANIDSTGDMSTPSARGKHFKLKV